MVKKAKLCYIYTHSFTVYIETDDIYKDIAEDVKTRFDTSNYELDSLHGKNKKAIELMRDGLGRKIMAKFVWLRAKTYSYLIGDGSEDKKTKGTKKCVIKRKLKFENHKNSLEVTQLDNEIKYLGKNKINVDNLKKIMKNS